MFEDLLTIFCVSIATSFLAEGITWFLVFRHDDIKRAQATADKLTAKVEKLKEAAAPAMKQKAKDKKIEVQEEQLKKAQGEITSARMKSMAAVGVTMAILFSILNTLFDGKVVAKLPFTPFGILHTFTHRNLLGENFTDCGMLFIYVLCSLSMRPNFQRLLGTSQPKLPSFFNMPEK